MLFLHLDGDSEWHRIFLDAGIGFWEKWSKEDTCYDYAELRQIDFSNRWGIAGTRILSARCETSAHEDSYISWFSLIFEAGTLTFAFAHPQDMDSQTVVAFMPATADKR